MALSFRDDNSTSIVDAPPRQPLCPRIPQGKHAGPDPQRARVSTPRDTCTSLATGLPHPETTPGDTRKWLVTAHRGRAHPQGSGGRYWGRPSSATAAGWRMDFFMKDRKSTRLNSSHVSI